MDLALYKEQVKLTRKENTQFFQRLKKVNPLRKITTSMKMLNIELRDPEENFLLKDLR